MNCVPASHISLYGNCPQQRLHFCDRSSLYSRKTMQPAQHSTVKRQINIVGYHSAIVHDTPCPAQFSQIQCKETTIAILDRSEFSRKLVNFLITKANLGKLKTLLLISYTLNPIDLQQIHNTIQQQTQGTARLLMHTASLEVQNLDQHQHRQIMQKIMQKVEEQKEPDTQSRISSTQSQILLKDKKKDVVPSGISNNARTFIQNEEEKMFISEQEKKMLMNQKNAPEPNHMDSDKCPCKCRLF